MPAQFLNQQNLAAMLNPNVVNLGQAVGAPLAQGLQRRDDFARQDQMIADKQARQDALLQQEANLRDDAAEAIAFLQQPQELWQQGLSAKLVQAQQDGDEEEIAGLTQLMQMDNVGIQNTLKEAALRGAHLLPSSALQGAGFGGNKTFAVSATQDPNLYKDSKGSLFKAKDVWNPNTQKSSREYVSVTPGGGQPIGDVSLASKQAQTADQVADAVFKIEEKKNQARNLADIGAAANKEEQKELGRLRGDIAADETKNFRASKGQDLQLKQLTNALRLADTGKYAQLKAFAGKYIPGVDPSDEQALQSIVTSYVMGELAKQVGPKTDFDFIKAAETQVQSGNTKAANDLILRRMKENQDYAKARWKAWQKFKKAGGNAEDFEDEFQYTSVFDKDSTSDSSDVSDEDLVNKYLTPQAQ
jgi:hypothetical protein